MKRAGFPERVFVHRCKYWDACLPAKAGGRIARKTTETGMFYCVLCTVHYSNNSSIVFIGKIIFPLSGKLINPYFL
jgi:hypothetical protein